MNYNGKIDLMKLGKVALVKGKQGQNCLMIDISGSDLFLSERTGSVYLNIVAWEQSSEFGSHTIKQQFSREKQDRLKTLGKDEHYKQNPILGSLKPFGSTSVPQTTVIPTSITPIDDDLPF